MKKNTLLIVGIIAAVGVVIYWLMNRNNQPNTVTLHLGIPNANTYAVLQ